MSALSFPATGQDGYGAIFKDAAEARRIVLKAEMADARRAKDDQWMRSVSHKLEALRWPPEPSPRQVREYFDRLAEERLSRGRHRFPAPAVEALIEQENGHG